MAAAFLTMWGVLRYNLPWYLSFAISAVIVVLMGLLVDRVAYKPLREKKTSSFIGAINVSFLLQNLFVVAFTSRSKPFPHPAILDQVIQMGRVALPVVNIAIVLVSAILFLILTFIVTRTNMGRAMRAVLPGPCRAGSDRRLYRRSFDFKPRNQAAQFLYRAPIWPISVVEWPLLPSLLLGGLLAAVVGFLIGAPALRLHGDYLLIVTFGFSEIIRLLLVNLPMVCNGAMGLKGIPYYSQLPWTFGMVILAVFICKRLVDSSYGRAMKCVREDEIAAEAVGVNLFYHKMLALVVSSFFVGIAGGLLSNILGTIDPNTFRPYLTYAIVTMAVLGGIKSLTGGIIAAGVYTVMSEVLRTVEAPRLIFNYQFPGIPGLRTLAFAAMLLLLILFARNGIIGDREFSWDWVLVIMKKISLQQEERKTLSILAIKNLTKRFGGLVAVSDFNLELEPGVIAELIGPNGSGKTTIFNVITGFYKPSEGHLYLDGKEISAFKPDRITKMGLTRIFQNSRGFRDLTVLDNVMIGEHLRLRSNPAAVILRTPGYNEEEKHAYNETMHLLEGLGLIQFVHEKAGALPYGLQHKLEVARSLSTHPKVLLLDEPATGMSTEKTDEMMSFILSVRKDFNLTILLIEHHMQVVMGICEYIVVLNYGRMIAHGTPKEIQSNQEVIDAYLGAGKSSTLRSVCGLVKPSGGQITLFGQDLLGLKAADRVKLGIAMVPEGRHVFTNLTVLENLLMGAYSRQDRANLKEDFEKIYGLFPKLRERSSQKALTLSGGEQQMLAVGRALMSRPKLLLLDELSLGLAPNLVAEMYKTFAKIHAEGLTIILVEQNARFALQLADYGYVLEIGRIVLEGTGKDLTENDGVKKAYIGA